MSLAETAQIYELLVKIDAILSGVTVKSDKLQADLPKLKETELTLRQEVRTLNILMMTMSRFSGSDTLSGTAAAIQRVLALLMRLRLTILAIQAASGPWGAIYAGANVLATSFAFYDTLQGTQL